MMSTPIRRYHREALGVVFEVRFSGSEDPGYLRTVLDTVWDQLAHVEGEVSPEQPGNALDAVLRMAEGERMRIPPHLRDCLALARRMRDETGGAFDPEGSSSPAPGVPEAGPAWELEGDDLLCHRPGWTLDLASLARGFALDRMADTLREWGVDQALLAAGGGLLLALEPPGDREGWRIAAGEWELRLRQVALACALPIWRNRARDPRSGAEVDLPGPLRAISGSAAEAACLARALAFGTAAEAEEWCRLGCGRGLWLADGTRLGAAAELDLRPLVPGEPRP
jgi:hypothetical protein